ncbi:hypothetical protein R6Q59_028518 [Mikania micrantha]
MVKLAILASYSRDEMLAVYVNFRSLAVDTPFATARNNLIIAFEKVDSCKMFFFVISCKRGCYSHKSLENGRVLQVEVGKKTEPAT